jgi:tetratricopeptide (TPR) repeat protein
MRFISSSRSIPQGLCLLIQNGKVVETAVSGRAGLAGLMLSLMAGAGGTSVWAQAPQPAPAPAPAAAAGSLNMEQEVESLYNEAFNLFQEGKYQEAIAKITTLKGKVSKPFEKVEFVEGASYFNLNDFPKAIKSLEFYLTTFPDGESLNSVRMALGRAYLSNKEPDKGIEILRKVAAEAPEFMAEAGVVIAEHLRTTDKADEALQILEKVLQGGIQSPASIQAAMLSADILVAKGEGEKASEMMEKVRGVAGGGGENVAQMNNISLKLGDQMLDKKSFKEALGAYQMVRRQSEISRMQKDRLALIEKSLANPGKGPIPGSKEELTARLDSEKKLLEEIEKRPDYDASLYYRLGRCYFEMGRFWESLLAFEVIVNDFKTFPQRDRALFGMIIANGQLKRVAQARALCETYISDFPDGANLGEVSEMYGMLAYNAGDMAGAEQSFDKALGFPKADKERLLFLRATVLFEMQRFEDARTCLELLLNANAKSAYKDDAQYRIALSYFYQNDFKSVTKALRTYVEENPKGQYVIDAKYRLAFIKFQGREVDEAMEDLKKLVEEAPNDQNIGQVYSLLGDGYNQRQDFPKALESFAKAVEKAKTDDVLNYAMDNATDLYASENKWKELADMWQSYYETHKDNEDQALKAISWISRARVRENKPEEAIKLLAEAIKPKIPNGANQQVEVLIQQLCGLMAPKRRKLPDGTYDGPTFEEKEKELEALIKPEEAGMNGTAQMRILFARAWLARQMKEPAKSEKLFAIIIEVAKPEDLSPLLLSTVGDNARSKGDLEKAAACYERLRSLFGESEFADAAPVGLAEIAFSKEEYDKAMELYNEAIEKYAASSKLLDANLGKAKTLMALKKWDEAKKMYEQISNTREWRGEATAISLFMLGEIEFQQKNPAGAIPFYQRVFIAHQKWKPWMAKSYLQCAKAFVQLNRSAAPPEREYSDREAAKLFLVQMTKRTDLEDQPEMKEARQLLSTL